MTSRHLMLTVALLLVTVLAVGCGGGENPPAATTGPTASPASFADDPTPTSPPADTLAVEPDATSTATRAASPTVTDVAPSPTAMPDVPIGETGNAEIYVMNADGSEQRRLTNLPTTEVRPAWSPDGSRLAFVSFNGGESGLYVSNADGSDMRHLSDAASSWPVWSPDGNRIAITGTDGEVQYEQVFVVDADGSGSQRLTSFENVPTATLSMGNVDPAWSPDGTQIAFVALQVDGPSEIHLMDADGTNVRRLTDSPTSKNRPVWSPDGSRIAFTTDFPDPEVWIMNADGTGLLNLTNDPAIDFGPAWSPDGEQIAFVRQSDIGGTQIMLVNTDGTNLHSIADISSPVEHLRWSPDGSKIAFAPFSEMGSLGIFVMNADGSDLRQITDTANGDGEPAWSPDGTQIAFTSVRDGGQPVECNWGVIADYGEAPSIESAIWSAHLIVAGTIIEQHDPAFGGPASGERGTGPAIYTDYTLEVERQFRGHPLETLRLRTHGGTIGDCMQTYDPKVSFAEGMRVLLFLGPETPDDVLPPAYFPDIVGNWTISAVDTVVTPGSSHNPEGVAEMTLDEVADLVTETLSATPPADTFNPVSLEESPATPQ